MLGLELQTIHRISQSQKRPLLGLSPGSPSAFTSFKTLLNRCLVSRRKIGLVRKGNNLLRDCKTGGWFAALVRISISVHCKSAWRGYLIVCGVWSEQVGGSGGFRWIDTTLCWLRSPGIVTWTSHEEKKSHTGCFQKSKIRNFSLLA